MSDFSNEKIIRGVAKFDELTGFLLTKDLTIKNIKYILATIHISFQERGIKETDNVKSILQGLENGENDIVFNPDKNCGGIIINRGSEIVDIPWNHYFLTNGQVIIIMAHDIAESSHAKQVFDIGEDNDDGKLF